MNSSQILVNVLGGFIEVGGKLFRKFFEFGLNFDIDFCEERSCLDFLLHDHPLQGLDSISELSGTALADERLDFVSYILD